LEWDLQRWVIIPFAILSHAEQLLHPLATRETHESVAPDAFLAEGSNLVFRWVSTPWLGSPIIS
jgi:hypothetical protein